MSTRLTTLLARLRFRGSSTKCRCGPAGVQISSCSPRSLGPFLGHQENLSGTIQMSAGISDLWGQLLLRVGWNGRGRLSSASPIATGLPHTCSCSMTVPTPDSTANIASSAIASWRLDNFLSACLINLLGLKDGPLLPGGLRGDGDDWLSSEDAVATRSGASLDARTIVCLAPAYRTDSFSRPDQKPRTPALGYARPACCSNLD